MNPQTQWKQFLGQARNVHGEVMDDDVLDLDNDADHFGAWSRNAMAPARTKKAKSHTFDGDVRRH